MIRVFDIIAAGARHLLIAAAILASLTTAFRAHLHVATAERHLHDSVSYPCSESHDGQVLLSTSTGDMIVPQDDDEGNALFNQDGGSQCDCPAPSADLPSAAPRLAASGFSREVRRMHDAAVPDGFYPQPDTPPAKG